MARCRGHWEDQDNPDFELNCDMDAGHMPVLKDHYDGLKHLYWHQNEVPVAVPYTPTGPLPTLKENKIYKGGRKLRAMLR